MSLALLTGSAVEEGLEDSTVVDLGNFAKVNSREEYVEKLGHQMLAEPSFSCFANRSKNTNSSVESLAKVIYCHETSELYEIFFTYSNLSNTDPNAS